MKISIGADHRGVQLKKYLIEQFSMYEWFDVGTHALERVDYPSFAHDVCQTIVDRKVDVGILICGSGVGMSIAANRFKGVYAALCWNKEVALSAREDDGSNILVLPSDFVSHEQAVVIFNAWMTATFKHGRYQARLDMVDSF